MTARFQPYREPLRATLTRTVAIALALGTALTLSVGGGLARWPASVLVMLWPAFGGHWVEIWFLNWLRPRLPDARSVQIAARLGVWFIGGTVLALGMGVTAMVLVGFQPSQWPAWWLGGLAFIGVELVAHLPLQLSGRASFYNGQG